MTDTKTGRYEILLQRCFNTKKEKNVGTNNWVNVFIDTDSLLNDPFKMSVLWSRFPPITSKSQKMH